MPTSYRLDPTERLVWSRAWGIVTDDELAAHSRALKMDARFAPDFRQLQDLIDVARWDVTADGLRRLAGLNPFGAGARRAVVAPSDVAFGLARMHESFRGDAPEELQVFRTLAAAVAWLALPASWEPPGASPDDPVFAADASPPAG